MPRGRTIGVLICAAMLAATLTLQQGCRRKPQQQVVLYVSVDEHIARDVLARFETATGITVRLVGDTEVKKTTGLVERLHSEQSSPQADVFWSSEIAQTVDLAEAGVLTEHLSDATKDWPREWRDGQRRWFAFAARPRVIVFAPDRLPEDQRPATWLDLTAVRWRGRIAMADPRFGTTGTHLGAMAWFWDRKVMPGYFAAWAQGLAANDVRILPSGNAGVVEAVARGEAEIGLTDADDVWAAQARGLAVALVYPAHEPLEPGGRFVEGHGTLLIPNTVARVRGGPNPTAAAALIDYLLSEDVERLLAESVSHNVPIRPLLRTAQYDVPAPLEVDWSKVAARRTAAIEQFYRAFETVKQERTDAAAASAEQPDREAGAPDER